MTLTIFFRKFIRKSFLETAKLPAETRTKFNLKNITRIFLFSIGIIVVLIVFLMPNESKRQLSPSNNLPDYPKPSGSNAQVTPPDGGAKSNSHTSSFGGGGIPPIRVAMTKLFKKRRN